MSWQSQIPSIRKTNQLCENSYRQQCDKNYLDRIHTNTDECGLLQQKWRNKREEIEKKKDHRPTSTQQLWHRLHQEHFFLKSSR